jgi:16S rRNA (cytosine967-C5)-methyltransferase
MLIEQKVAAEAVGSVLLGRSLTPTLEQLFERNPSLDTGQRAAVWDITYGSMRMLGLLRAVLAQMLRRPLNEPRLEALLAVSLYQLEFTRARPHAVVHRAVDAAAALGWPWAKGMVNALLRRFQRERETLLNVARADEVGRYSYPRWWISRVRAAYPRQWERVLDAGNERPPMFVRVNLRRCSRTDYLERLAGMALEAQVFGDAGVMIVPAIPVARLPGFEQGLVSVQDAGAQLAAGFLDLAPGQRVLDACAAPGGKTAHILERSDVELLALDSDANRIGRIRDTLQRLGLKAEVCCADAADLPAWWDRRVFDRVLADVPCTASGVVRRHPDIKWLRRETDLASLAAQAGRLLDALWHVLAPGGKLLFATCSVFQEENRAQVDDFVGRHADARLAPLPGQDDSDVQLLPDDSHDGFYYALLERI